MSAIVDSILEELSRKYHVPKPRYEITGDLPPGVVGAYEPVNETIYISRNLLKKPPEVIKHVVAHEFEHYLQDMRGMIGPFSPLRPVKREILEAMAESRAKQISGLLATFPFRMNARFFCMLYDLEQNSETT